MPSFSSTWPISAAVALTLVLVGGAIVLFPYDGHADADARDGGDSRPAVADQLEPGDTFVRIERVYQRHGPIAEQVRERVPNAGPEIQVITTRSVFGADGCVASVTSTRTTGDGTVLDETSSTPDDGTIMGGILAGTCIEEFQAQGEDSFEQVMATPDAAIVSEADEQIEVAVPDPAPPDDDSGISLPYTGDLDIVGSSGHFFFEADSSQLTAFERRAELSDGSSVILERFEVVSETIE